MVIPDLSIRLLRNFPPCPFRQTRRSRTRRNRISSIANSVAGSWRSGLKFSPFFLSFRRNVPQRNVGREIRLIFLPLHCCRNKFREFISRSSLDVRQSASWKILDVNIRDIFILPIFCYIHRIHRTLLILFTSCRVPFISVIYCNASLIINYSFNNSNT